MEPEERIVTDRLRRKLDEVNRAAQLHFACIEDHVNFTLQKAYFKCAYECFDRKKNHEEIGRCVEHCSAPVVNAQSVVQNETAIFQEKMQRALLVCQDKFEAAKFQMNKGDAVNNLESCVDLSVQDSIKTLPHIVGRLKTKLSMTDSV